MILTPTYRETKYCNAIRQKIKTLDHPTNNELLHALRYDFPELSATTVHRATARLATRGEIGIAPPNKHGAVRYDTVTRPHDYFNCSICDRLCDADIKEKILPIIESVVRGCSFSGNIVVSGICKLCSEASV